MPKPKKSRKNRRSQEEEQSDSSESESCNSATEARHHKQKSSKHSNKKNRSKNSDSDDSSSSSSRSTSASDQSDSATRKTSKHSKRLDKVGDKRVRNEDEQRERKQRRRTHSRERQEISSGGEPHVSKWDSPERRNRQRSRSRSRQRQRQSRERERSEQRDAIRSYGDRNDRGNRPRTEYAGRDRLLDRRDYRDRYVNRNREERWRDERGNQNEQSNERRGRSRSPRDKAPNRSQGNDRFKREPREHSRQQNSPVRRGRRRNSRDDDSKNYEWGGKRGDDKYDAAQIKEEPIEKEKPNFGLSGALLEDTNKVNGVVVKYAEPPEARKPKRRWRLYPFKGETALPTLHIHRQSCFLVGRDRKVADLAVDHPSCSKQHAALQYRLVPFEREDGSQGKRVRLYLIDLESANGTFLNNKKIEARKYYELIEKDVIKFGFSTREYVLLHENSKEDQEDDDVFVKPEPEDVPDGPNP